LEGCPSIKAGQTIHTENQTTGPTTKHINIDNTRDLINKLKDTPTLPHFALASLDITNLHTNIPVTETHEILSNTLGQNLLDPQTRYELIRWYNIITEQNYFTNNGEVLIQNDGPAMGAPTFGLTAEFFLQNLEHLHLAHLSKKHKIINYFWYVDNILVIYDANNTDTQNILDDFNAVHPKLKFTAETETNNKINYLEITIQRTPTNWKTSVYRKPTFTDTTIPYTSNHPAQHKYTIVRFLYNRLNTYDLHEDEYKTEENIIQNIMHNNAFPIHPRKPSNQGPPISTAGRQTITTKAPTHEWTTLTYIGKGNCFYH